MGRDSCDRDGRMNGRPRGRFSSHHTNSRRWRRSKSWLPAVDVTPMYRNTPESTLFGTTRRTGEMAREHAMRAWMRSCVTRCSHTPTATVFISTLPELSPDASSKPSLAVFFAAATLGSPHMLRLRARLAATNPLDSSIDLPPVVTSTGTALYSVSETRCVIERTVAA